MNDEFREKEDIRDIWHWRTPEYRQRMTTQAWRNILLSNDDSIIFRGNIVKLKAESIGYGVVEVFKDFKNESESKE